jgi:hypothetical protein
VYRQMVHPDSLCITDPGSQPLQKPALVCSALVQRERRAATSGEDWPGCPIIRPSPHLATFLYSRRSSPFISSFRCSLLVHIWKARSWFMLLDYPYLIIWPVTILIVSTETLWNSTPLCVLSAACGRGDLPGATEIVMARVVSTLQCRFNR